jgi:spore coat protein A
MELTRKEMLKVSLLAGAALLLPLERRARTGLRLAGRIPESRLPEPFQTTFAVPPVLRPVRRSSNTDFYQITMRSARVPILPGFPPTEIYGYNGITPGPTILARRDRRAVVRQINRLPRVSAFGYETTTSVHLHGSDSPPQYDGYAEDVTRPGYYKDYRYPNDQDARTLWYHDHAIHHTAQNAYMGLAAQYHLYDVLERRLPIPKGYGRYDIPLIIRDGIFGTDGSLLYDDESHSSLFGDVVLVNGRPWPVMKVERRKYRFRVLNASVSRSYELVLGSGDPMTVIATDGGLMPAPQEVGRLRLGMAERYEVIIDFSRYRVGQSVTLRNRSPKNNADYDSVRQVMRFQVAGEASSTANNTIPRILNPNNPAMKLKESESTHTRQWVFERKNGQWTISGRTWDKDRVDEFCGLDQVEVWELVNKSGGWFHPVHTHLIDFRILDRNGAPPRTQELGPKDVAYVGENETVRVLTKFGPRQGRYMMHCHNLVHEDHDMMTQFEVGTGGPDPIESARPKRLPAPPL